MIQRFRPRIPIFKSDLSFTFFSLITKGVRWLLHRLTSNETLSSLSIKCLISLRKIFCCIELLSRLWLAFEQLQLVKDEGLEKCVITLAKRDYIQQ
jgi:hypothetical protein